MMSGPTRPAGGAADRRERPAHAVEATLLALGIHEDTGSLDLRVHHRPRCPLPGLADAAEASCQSVGAQSLSQPPADRCPATAVRRTDRQQRVSGDRRPQRRDCSGFGPRFQDEISALASRLRDFHETSAIFLVIDSGRHDPGRGAQHHRRGRCRRHDARTGRRRPQPGGGRACPRVRLDG